MVRRIVLIGSLALIAVILFLPLSLAARIIGLDDMGVSARQLGGTIWSGQMEQAHMGALDLGTLDVGLNPAPLLLGRATMDFDRVHSNTMPDLSGTITMASGLRAVEGLTGTILGSGDSGLPIEQISFTDAQATFTDGRCTSASGRVQLVLGIRFAGLDLRHGLSGDMDCEGDRLRAVLNGESGMEKLTIRIDGDGKYLARFGVQSADPMLGAALTAAGFGSTAEGYVRGFRGQF